MLRQIVSFFSNRSSNIQTKNPGWGGWLDTPEGKEFEEMRTRVYSFIENHKYLVDGEKRRFVNGKIRISLDEMLKKTAESLNESEDNILEHILFWLSEASMNASFEPELNGTEEYADLVEQWVEDECSRRGIDLHG